MQLHLKIKLEKIIDQMNITNKAAIFTIIR
jgi:hypothetical protein